MKQKLDENHLADKRFQESLNKRAAQIKEQTEIQKLVKQLQVMRVEIDIQRAEAIQLNQAVDSQQYEKLESCLHALLTYAENWYIEQYKNTQFSMLNEEISIADFQQFNTLQPTILKRTRTEHKNVHVSLGPLTQRMFPLENLIEETIRTNGTFNSWKIFL